MSCSILTIRELGHDADGTICQSLRPEPNGIRCRQRVRNDGKQRWRRCVSISALLSTDSGRGV